ncbi:hypothetical protein [Sphingomonas sp. S2-65]|uniref:hypothetical protein n=1 Tax=Sphingomonas sp. S2-65 TaxID=2903960 RepID=UPI001F1EAA16|nr:hypothetical protein [Sphingomonas sp. S2-65]UYY57223.1 hypothetical protein LZ586_11045 [Sphingomonas sp. S2-65]
MSARLLLAGFAAAALLGCNSVVASNSDAPATSAIAASEPVTAPTPAAAPAPGAAAVADAPAAQAGLTWSQDPTSKCGFVAPRSLGTGPTFWTGDCPGGKADGLGMLRRRDGGQAGTVFYGELRAGVPVIGAIDDDGYVVGKFVGGDLVQDSLEPQVAIDSFRTAAKAARSVSARFKAQNNAGSARYYAETAERLEMQIE